LNLARKPCLKLADFEDISNLLDLAGFETIRIGKKYYFIQVSEPWRINFWKVWPSTTRLDQSHRRVLDLIFRTARALFRNRSARNAGNIENILKEYQKWSTQN
jgi:hypothetical protein